MKKLFLIAIMMFTFVSTYALDSHEIIASPDTEISITVNDFKIAPDFLFQTNISEALLNIPIPYLQTLENAKIFNSSNYIRFCTFSNGDYIDLMDDGTYVYHYKYQKGSLQMTIEEEEMEITRAQAISMCHQHGV